MAGWIKRNAVAVVSLGLGGIVGVSLVLWQGEKAVSVISQPPTKKEAARAWHESQPAPPHLLTQPDQPIFPDGVRPDEKTAGRAYEEALPKDVYVPPLKAKIKPPPRQPTAEQPVEQAAWQRFAVAVPPANGRPRIAIVIDDMGVDRKHSASAIELPRPLTLSYLTYARDLEAQTRAAHDAGHELMLHVAMEPTSKKVDPGPNALLTTLDETELRRRLDWGLARFKGYVGINNHMGSRFTEDEAAISVVMDAIEKRGLLFLDSRTSPKTVAARIARVKGVAVLERNVFLDHGTKAGEAERRLAEVERIAMAHGRAIAIGHPRGKTLIALRAWIPTLEKKGFQLVPLTALLNGGAEVAAKP